MVTMDEVIRAFKSRGSEERIPVLRLELDYELALLYEAIHENNHIKKCKCIKRLTELRREMILLEEW